MKIFYELENVIISILNKKFQSDKFMSFLQKRYIWNIGSKSQHENQRCLEILSYNRHKAEYRLRLPEPELYNLDMYEIYQEVVDDIESLDIVLIQKTATLWHINKYIGIEVQASNSEVITTQCELTYSILHKDSIISTSGEICRYGPKALIKLSGDSKIRDISRYSPSELFTIKYNDDIFSTITSSFTNTYSSWIWNLEVVQMPVRMIENI